MEFEQLATEAGRALRESASTATAPPIADARSRRRVRTNVGALATAFALTVALVGAVALWPSATDGSVAPAAGDSLAASLAVITDLPTDSRLPLQVLAVRPSPPSLSLVDFEEGLATEYPPGVHALPSDAVGGAVAVPGGGFVVVTDGVARYLAGPFDEAPQIVGPAEPRRLDGVAPVVRAHPTPDGSRLWLVQPGIGFGDDPQPALAELVSLPGGDLVVAAELDPTALPAGAVDAGLVLNIERFVDTGDGFTTEPGSERVVLLRPDGSTARIGPGRAVAAGGDVVARVVCEPDCRLEVGSVDGSSSRTVAPPTGGSWRSVGGPPIPSDASPLPTVSPDGTQVLVAIGDGPDVAVAVVDVATGSATVVAEAAEPVATWSRDGRRVVVFTGRDAILVDPAAPESAEVVAGVFPADHAPLAAR